MNNEAEVKQKILQKSDEMFRQFGCSKVTMEEIAANVGISKKTLYKHFSNKESVLRELFVVAKCEIGAFINNLLNDDSLDFIVKLENLMNYLAQHSARLEGPFVQDLMKNFPNMWIEMQEFRKHNAHQDFARLLEQGVQKGIFREDLKSQIVVIAYISTMHSMLNPEVLSSLPFSADQVFNEVIRIFFEGLLSEEGRKNYHTIQK